MDPKSINIDATCIKYGRDIYKSQAQLQRTTSFTTDVNSNFNGNHNNNLNGNVRVQPVDHTNGNLLLENENVKPPPTDEEIPEPIMDDPKVESNSIHEEPISNPATETSSPVKEPEEPVKPTVSEAVESGPSSLKSITIEEEIENDSAPPARPPSIKSIQPIEEEIEEEVAIDEVDKALPSAIEEEVKQDEIALPEEVPKPLPSPTIEEIKALSRRSSIAKSCDSIYHRPSSVFERRPHSKSEPDNKSIGSSESNSEQSRGSLEDSFVTIKETGRRRKSIFSKNNRRVSPVKQSIKMVKGELFPQTLPRFERPRDGLMKSFDMLDSANWEDIITGLRFLIRLIRHHPETIDNQMHMVCIQLTKSVRNLRSQVARAACQSATEIFSMKSKNLESECDDLVASLLHRTADTNRFLRADAFRALESMCDNLTPSKILQLLITKGANHQNAIVRTTTAKLLNRLADRWYDFCFMGLDGNSFIVVIC
uniref:CLASP N-terminal domain-containing protein n=1 Tax=Megaselia scalaris TaxID=36166 RepID=T1GWK5_MEGSC